MDVIIFSVIIVLVIYFFVINNSFYMSNLITYLIGIQSHFLIVFKWQIERFVMFAQKYSPNVLFIELSVEWQMLEFILIFFLCGKTMITYI